MRAVVDTNVLISGLLWRGAPHTLIEQARTGTFIMVSSKILIDELAEVLGRPKFKRILLRARVSPQSVLREVVRLAEIVEAPALRIPASRDADDDHVLAAAIVGQADLIVSGDLDLLSLGDHKGVRIVAPATAIRMIRA